MGLAVLPARLSVEIKELKKAMLNGENLADNPLTASHAKWATEILEKYPEFSENNAEEILNKEIGAVFEQVLCDAGVFKRDAEGKKAFMRFVNSL
jgi:UDPglucose--hexose-1-phosphate uridylyltransferase